MAEQKLPNIWINFLRVEINRDSTWKGAVSPTVTVRRTTKFIPAGSPATQDLSTLELPHSLSTTAVDGDPERDRIILIYLDAFSAPLFHTLPQYLRLHCELKAQLENLQSPSLASENTVPVTTQPRQLPQLVSAGHALSPYASDDAYAATAPRSRMLWFEMAQPPEDPRDAYFVRVIAHSPYPLMLPCAEPVADPPDCKSPLDPELVRVILPGQADDFAGLATI